MMSGSSRISGLGKVARSLIVVVGLFAVPCSADATFVTAEVVRDDPPADSRAVLVLGFDSDQEPTRRVPIEIGVPFDIPHTPELRRATVERDGYWSEEIGFGAKPRRAATIRLVKALEIAFPIEARPSADLPSEVLVTFESVPSPRSDDAARDLAGSAECEVKEREARCCLPSLALDLRFAAEGVAPFYLWGLGLEEGSPDRVPALELKPGGTILGRAVDEGDDPVADADVYLMPPLASRAHDPILAARLRRLALESSTNERGYFQLVGIPDGSYRVILDKPGLATTEATPEPILVHESEHVLEDAVTLRPAAGLLLALSPALDSSSNPWQVRAHPRNAIQHLVAESATLQYQSGSYAAEGLVPGAYDLMVESSEGERWWIQAIDLLPGPQYVEITMDHLTVAGTVTAGDAPVAGLLILDKGGASLEFHVDEEGEFGGMLPEPGCWAARVLPREQDGVEIALRCKPIEPAEGVATLHLVLPNTRIEGEVVDSLGQPVENATVRVYSKGSGRALSHARSGPHGEFELLGVPPGPAGLVAESSGRESESREILLGEGEETSRQVLVLREEGEVAGQVSIAGGGPLVGAQVVLWPELGTVPGARVQVTATDMNGAFEASVPADVGWLNLIVSAPGFGTRILREPRRPGQPLLIELEPGGGQLLVELAASEGDEKSLARTAGRAVISFEGVTVPLPMLRIVAVEGPPVSMTGRMQLDSMAPGSYSLCTLDVPHSASGATAPPTQRCANAALARGGHAVLSASEPAADS